MSFEHVQQQCLEIGRIRGRVVVQGLGDLADIGMAEFTFPAGAGLSMPRGVDQGKPRRQVRVRRQTGEGLGGVGSSSICELADQARHSAVAGFGQSAAGDAVGETGGQQLEVAGRHISGQVVWGMAREHHVEQGVRGVVEECAAVLVGLEKEGGGKPKGPLS